VATGVGIDFVCLCLQHGRYVGAVVYGIIIERGAQPDFLAPWVGPLFFSSLPPLSVSEEAERERREGKRGPERRKDQARCSEKNCCFSLYGIPIRPNSLWFLKK